MDGDVKLGKSLIKNFHDLFAIVYLYEQMTNLDETLQMQPSETIKK